MNHTNPPNGPAGITCHYADGTSHTFTRSTLPPHIADLIKETDVIIHQDDFDDTAAIPRKRQPVGWPTYALGGIGVVLLSIVTLAIPYLPAIVAKFLAP